MSSFELERKLFQEFRIGLALNPLVLDEFLSACRVVNQRFNTAIYENRFIVGGVVEQLLGASMRAVGLQIENVAKTSRGVDLFSPSMGVGLSVKAQFKKASEFRLVNTMGGSGLSARWDHATLFVVVGVGVGYADPGQIASGLLPRSDVLVLRMEALKEFWSSQPEFLIECEVPSKPDDLGTSRVASDVVAQDIMIEFRKLLIHYQPER
jgi:hypothetical protein